MRGEHAPEGGPARGPGASRVTITGRRGGMAAGGVLAILGLALVACGGNKPQPAAESQPAAAAGDVTGAAARQIATTNGFSSPESIVYDSAADNYFVSNVNGPIGVAPGHGYISRLHADGTIDSLHFIVGGKNGVTLNAPAGLRLHHDTLWVADIDVLRAFDPQSGKPLRTLSFRSLHPHILNDYDWGGPNDDVYVTDMGMYGNPKGMPKPGALMRILTVHNGTPAVALTSKLLNTPDGIAWDGTNKRFIINPFGTNSDSVLAWAPGDKAPHGVAAGKGKFDGIEYEHDGTIYITSWNAQEVQKLAGDSLVTVAKGFQAPSDVTLDTRRNQLGITDYQGNSVAVVALANNIATASGVTAPGRADSASKTR